MAGERGLVGIRGVRAVGLGDVGVADGTGGIEAGDPVGAVVVHLADAGLLEREFGGDVEMARVEDLDQQRGDEHADDGEETAPELVGGRDEEVVGCRAAAQHDRLDEGVDDPDAEGRDDARQRYERDAIGPAESL